MTILKKTIFVILIIILSTGCGYKDKRTKIYTKEINNSKYKTSDYKIMNCKTDAEGTSGEKVTLKYEVYYDDSKFVKVLKSFTKIKTTDKEILNNYEKSYKTIYKSYDNIDYYDYFVTKDDKSVTCIVYINYGKVDMDKVLDIEGKEDNVKLTNGKIKLSDWRSFAKKFGTTCTT